MSLHTGRITHAELQKLANTPINAKMLTAMFKSPKHKPEKQVNEDVEEEFSEEADESSAESEDGGKEWNLFSFLLHNK